MAVGEENHQIFVIAVRSIGAPSKQRQTVMKDLSHYRKCYFQKWLDLGLTEVRIKQRFWRFCHHLTTLLPDSAQLRRGGKRAAVCAACDFDKSAQLDAQLADCNTHVLVRN